MQKKTLGKIKYYRFSGDIFFMPLDHSFNSSREYFVLTRFTDAGWCFNPTPALREAEGRMGLGVNPPPQFGQTFDRI